MEPPEFKKGFCSPPGGVRQRTVVSAQKEKGDRSLPIFLANDPTKGLVAVCFVVTERVVVVVTYVLIVTSSS
jgi:hypothetical protein